MNKRVTGETCCEAEGARAEGMITRGGIRKRNTSGGAERAGHRGKERL